LIFSLVFSFFSLVSNLFFSSVRSTNLNGEKKRK
jgi:hypothetical protein